MTSILALDIATTTGFAYSCGAEVPVYGAKRMGRTGAALGEVYVIFRDWLGERLDEWQPRILVFEAPILVGRGSTQVVQRLMGLAAHADEMGTRRGLKVYRAEGATVTKAFTGKARFAGGREEKKRVVMQTCRLYGWSPIDDNAADALALLHYSQSLLGRGLVQRAAGPLFAGA